MDGTPTDCVHLAITGLLDEEPDIVEAPKPVAIGQIQGRVEFKDVTLEYNPGEPVLRGVSLELSAGQNLAVVGPSGCGKSTLLHILGTLDRPTQGQVIFNGEDIFSYSSSKLARFRNRHIGFVFQFHHLLPEFTALENVMMPALIHRESKADAVRDRIVRGVVAMSGLRPGAR